MQIAVYDMDLTITAWPTYTRWLIFWARRNAPWRLALLPAAGLAGLGFRLGVLSRGQVKEVAQRLLMGASVERATVAEAAEAFAATVAVRPGALAQLAADRAVGLPIVLATASFDYYAAAIAIRLGIDTVVATKSRWVGERLHPRLAGDNCYGTAKLVMILAEFPEATIARAYSDHMTDTPLLMAATEAIAVNPSRDLKRFAEGNGWPIVDWR